MSRDAHIDGFYEEFVEFVESQQSIRYGQLFRELLSRFNDTESMQFIHWFKEEFSNTHMNDTVDTNFIIMMFEAHYPNWYATLRISDFDFEDF